MSCEEDGIDWQEERVADDGICDAIDARSLLESLPSRGLVFLALHSVSPGTPGSWQASWTDAAADAARAMERN